jgi:ribosomal protein S18 acetylase RimI-like enzyme
MTEITIRRGEAADKPFLRRMQWQAILASPGLVARVGGERLQALEDQTWAAWPRPDEVAFIAHSAEGVSLGAVLLRVQERAGDQIAGYRLAIAVDAYARGHGVGRLLMQRAARFARSRGASYMRLEVDPANTTAIQLYRSEGYATGDPHGLISMTLHFEE